MPKARPVAGGLDDEQYQWQRQQLAGPDVWERIPEHPDAAVWPGVQMDGGSARGPAPRWNPRPQSAPPQYPRSFFGAKASNGRQGCRGGAPASTAPAANLQELMRAGRVRYAPGRSLPGLDDAIKATQGNTGHGTRNTSTSNSALSGAAATRGKFPPKAPPHHPPEVLRTGRAGAAAAGAPGHRQQNATTP
ncbi:hypothetical protein Purlil1_11440 [Purpureocillium lilacinum]|uniref:Uncharacterized protein n=1 Tax=Purpureocillium lilacinum TaxID=33203 RepID=A0ABR0BJL0_PURLI|nr:hypothetical protein Purlil1_11440 [Purpureocillium lilacinum]